jgi:hypothetical protein
MDPAYWFRFLATVFSSTSPPQKPETICVAIETDSKHDNIDSLADSVQVAAKRTEDN